MKYEVIKKNKRLTDYEEVRPSVVSNHVKNVPYIKKKEKSIQLRFSKH